MNFKNIISKAKSFNTKLGNKFDSINKISANMLIFGQLFIILTLCAGMFYGVWFCPKSIVLIDIFKSVHFLFDNAASGLCLLWIVAVYIDYIDKRNR